MNEESIFSAAIELPTAADRAAYLDRVCADDAGLRAQIEALMRAHDQPESFFEAPAAPADTHTRLLVTEGPGTRVGPYKLREQIGEGGMGYVYVAEQTKPVRRKVALKVIKPGMDTKEVIARFEAERQALAMMSHPNIAKVLDGGATDQGRPYFVMELVRGVPITKFCDQHKLTTRERLELFLKVCQAVQHAHMKGVIHRDLKPSNVIVEVDDVRPIPKVIDFGVAKATGQQLSQHTVYTQFAQLVGTPLYMSPEQAKQSSTDIDTRSDIYSLGVLLYELLTGTTPFDKATLSSVNITELQRIICEDEPPRPSLRISTLKNEQISTISASRKTEPRQLGLSMQRELDWIVMKALEKDRTRRYESASAFAADVQRYLDDEPVLACPPSVKYRVRKYVQKHKVALTTVVLIALALIAGIWGSLWYANEALEAEELANKQKQEAVVQRQRAEANLRLAMQILDEVFEDLAVMQITQGPGALNDVSTGQFNEEKLRTALALYEKLAMQLADNPRMQSLQGTVYLRVGDIRRFLGQTEGAKRATERAVAIFEQSVVRSPDDPLLQHRLASACYSLGKFSSTREERIRHRQRCETLWDDLSTQYPTVSLYADRVALSRATIGFDHSQLGQAQEAIEPLQSATRIWEELAENDPDRVWYRQEIAYFSNALGAALRDVGRSEEAARAFRRAIVLHEALVRDIPTEVYKRRLATSYRLLFGLYDSLGRQEEALHEMLLLANENVAEQDSGSVRIGRAILLKALGQDELAEADLDKAIELEPENYDWRTRRISFFSERERWEDATADLAMAIELKPTEHYHYYQLALVALKNHDDAKYRTTCQTMLERFADSGKPMETQFTAWTCALGPDAVDDYAEPLRLAESAIAAEPENQQYLNSLGAIQLRAGLHEEALATFEKSAAAESDSTSSAYDDYFRSLAEHALDHTDAARQSLARANELAAAELESETDLPAWNRKLTLELLRAEAEGLIGAEAEDDEQEPPTPKGNNDELTTPDC